MSCNRHKNTKHQLVTLSVGVVSLLFGIFGIYKNPAASGNEARLLGMFTGFGAAWIVVGIVFLLRSKYMSKEKLKQEEINLKDERNIQIYRAAYTNANFACMIIFALMAFVFVGLGYQVPGIIAVGALWVQAAVFLVSVFYFNKKM